ncbi:MAG: LysR family transcriptional regulator [Rubrivivax sp.]|nr:MAG: LysR family transcriptional regulator [Rubrivivax sp.]
MPIENLSELRVLLACARLGSLSAAARHLDLSPAAASASLKKLESRLSVRLIERSTRALRPTPAGDTLIAHAQAAIDLLEEATSQMGDQRQELRGLIRITAPSDLTRRVLLPLIDQFLARHPAVSIRLNVSDRLQDLLKDEVDVALRYGDLPDSQRVARLLTSTRRVVCAAPSYLAHHSAPRTPADLASHECITFGMRNRPEQQWRLWRADATHVPPVAVKVSGRRHCDDGELAHRWALQGHGVVYKSGLDVRESLQEGRLVQLLPEYVGESLPLNAVLPSQRFVPATVRAFLEYIAQELRD